VRITKYQTVFNSVQRNLEGYATYRSSPASQWRLSAGSLLRQPSLSRTVYADVGGRKENADSLGNPAWIRVGYERQF
jgi:hypothetical protein